MLLKIEVKWVHFVTKFRTTCMFDIIRQKNIKIKHSLKRQFQIYISTINFTIRSKREITIFRLIIEVNCEFFFFFGNPLSIIFEVNLIDNKTVATKNMLRINMGN